MQARVGLATKAKAPFEAKDDNSLEEPKLECAPGHSIGPSVAGSAHGAIPVTLRSREAALGSGSATISAFIGKLHEFLKCTREALNLRGQVAGLPER